MILPDRYGIDRIYVSGLGSFVPDAEEVRELNDHVFELMKRYKRIQGYCCVNPALPGELKRGIEELGMSGIVKSPDINFSISC